jgi:hypothetical protein
MSWVTCGACGSTIGFCRHAKVSFGISGEVVASAARIPRSSLSCDDYFEACPECTRKYDDSHRAYCGVQTCQFCGGDPNTPGHYMPKPGSGGLEIACVADGRRPWWEVSA